MTLRTVRVGIVLVAVSLVACGRPEPPTAHRLRAAVAAYTLAKPDPTEQQVDALFAQLDADVAALRAEAASNPDGEAGTRAQALQAERLELWQVYVKAKVERLRGTAERALRDLGKQVGQGVEEAGRRVQESMEKRPD